MSAALEQKTLLDEFAQTALLAILQTRTTEVKTWEFDLYATRAYALAESMMRARSTAP